MIMKPILKKNWCIRKRNKTLTPIFKKQGILIKIKFKEYIKGKEYEITLTKIKEVKFKNVNNSSGPNQKIKLYIETLLRNIVMKNPNVIYFKDRTLIQNKFQFYSILIWKNKLLKKYMKN